MIDVEQRVAKARQLFMLGYNCSQAVFCAYSDLYDIPMEMAFRMSASFGGGLGRLREMCGTVSGMAMLAGMERGQVLPDDPEQKKKNYELVQFLAGRFKEENGSYICRELLRLRKDAPLPPVPDERTAEYYRKRPCLRMVESSACIFGQWYNKAHSSLM